MNMTNQLRNETCESDGHSMSKAPKPQIEKKEMEKTKKPLRLEVEVGAFASDTDVGPKG